MMRLTLLLAILLISCHTSKKTPEQIAYEQREQRIKRAAECRAEFPCDTSTITITHTDTAIKFISLPGDTVVSNDTVYINQTRQVTHTVERIATVVDYSLLQAARDSVDNLSFLLDAAIQSNADSDKVISGQKDKISSLSTWRGIGIGAGIALLIILGLSAFSLFKNKL